MTAADVASATGGELVAGNPAERFPTVSIDSRTLAPGDLFVAIAGPRFDGHEFVAAALARGAAGVVVSRTDAVPSATTVPVVRVADTVAALQDLARHVRRASGARVVAITGSAGKTTTKEATATVLEARYRTLRNRGNLNNHIGLPLSLLGLQDGAEIAVMELGMNHAGEIRQLVGIAEPEVRVWTNVGTAHIGYFGSMDAIAAAKAEILEGAMPDHVLVANRDDPRVMRHARGFAGRVLTFGVEAPEADVRPEQVDDRGLDGLSASVRTPVGPVALETRLVGRAHLSNLLAATAVAVHFEVPAEAIGARLRQLGPGSHRGEVLRLRGGDVTVLDDCYNASPSALKAQLDLIASDRSGRRRVAWLGEMLELGDEAISLHRECGRAVAEAGVAALVTVGGEAARALGEAAVAAGLDPTAAVHVDASDAAAGLVGATVRRGDLVLVKGSRGVRMERVVERIAAEFA